MKNIIHLKCGIENCKGHGFDYELDLINPIAVNGLFKDEKSKDGDWGGLLPNKPKVGKEYELTLSGPLEIDINEKFWVLYLDPYSTSEGIEDENGINSFAFCLCEKIKLIEVQERMMTLKVKIVERKELINDFVHLEKKFNSFDVLDMHVSSKSYHVDNFKHYSLIIINVQSDIGWTYIIDKRNKKSVIVAENIWGIHEDIWKLLNAELTEQEEKKYGIVHYL